jgi:hypothetical protein
MAAAEAAPPKGGLLAVHKPMKLPGDERRNSFGPKSAPLLCAGGEIVVCGVPAGFTGWLLRRALAQYSRLVFSVLDGLRAGGHLLALLARALLKATGILNEIPVPFVVILAIACAGTFAMWLLWLS